MTTIFDGNTLKYLISLEPMYTQGVGNFFMITSNKYFGEIFRQEIFKYKNHIVNTENDLCGWVFYENIYKVLSIKQLNDEEFEYALEEIHSYEYEPNKHNDSKIKKVNWKKCIKNKNCSEHNYNKLLKENYVYNSIDDKISEINLKYFNMLMWNNNDKNN